jgi:DNA polymerase III subunit epsilon
VNWREQPIAVLDTETGGTDIARHRVCEVAIRIISPGQPVFAKSWLVDPGSPIPAEATKVHGITDEMVRNAPTFHDVAHELWMLVSACIPAAYNARFDRAMLIAEYLRARIDPPEFLHAGKPFIDVLAWARASEPRLSNGNGNFKLAKCAERNGVAVGTAHRAAGDCETTAGLLKHLAGATWGDTGEPVMPETIEELMLQQRVLIADNELGYARWAARQPKKEAA